MAHEYRAVKERRQKISSRIICLCFVALALMLAPRRAESLKLPVPAVDQSAVGKRGYFYVGGKYVGEPGKEIMEGQACVEVLAPRDQRRPYPLVQWPGEGPNKGKMGDPVFDAFYATHVETVISNEETQQRNKDAGAVLLDRIGPAIVLTHSQSGAFGWLIADARPQLTKAIVVIEPAGPPFEATIIGTGKARAFGPTDIAITYDPPIKELERACLRARGEGRRAGPVRVLDAEGAGTRLVNLRGIPVVIMAAEASYHQVYDHCTVKYLNQAPA